MLRSKKNSVRAVDLAIMAGKPGARKYVPLLLTLTIVATATSPATSSSEPGATRTLAASVASPGAPSNAARTLSWLSVTTADDTWEYAIHPFHHSNHRTEEEFEEFLDGLGAEGWRSVAQLPGEDLLDETDDRRLFKRQVGGPEIVVDFEIERYRAPIMGGPETYVPQYQALGADGKFPVLLYELGNQVRVITEAGTVDGEPVSWAWDMQRIGENPINASEWKGAVKKLAKRGTVLWSQGPSDDLQDSLLVGVDQTVGPARASNVKMRFKNARLTTARAKLERLIAKQARKGFRVTLWPFIGTSQSFLAFARQKIERETVRGTCVLDPFDFFNPDNSLPGLNDLGAEGYEALTILPVGGFDRPHTLLCTTD